MSQLGVREIDAYNQAVKRAEGFLKEAGLLFQQRGIVGDPQIHINGQIHSLALLTLDPDLILRMSVNPSLDRRTVVHASLDDSRYIMGLISYKILTSHNADPGIIHRLLNGNEIELYSRTPEDLVNILRERSFLLA